MALALQGNGGHPYLSASALQEAQQDLVLQQTLYSQQARGSSSLSPLTAAAVAAEYLQGLQQGASTAAAAVKPSTHTAAARAWAEFSSWMEARQAVTGRGPWQAVPQDVQVYFEMHWLQRHGELLLSDGQLHASPGYLQSTLSHLSTIFTRAGMTHAWDPAMQASWTWLYICSRKVTMLCPGLRQHTLPWEIE